MTAYSNLYNAVSAYEGGAFEYLPKPFDLDHAVSLVRPTALPCRKFRNYWVSPQQCNRYSGPLAGWLAPVPRCLLPESQAQVRNSLHAHYTTTDLVLDDR